MFLPRQAVVEFPRRQRCRLVKPALSPRRSDTPTQSNRSDRLSQNTFLLRSTVADSPQFRRSADTAIPTTHLTIQNARKSSAAGLSAPRKSGQRGGLVWGTEPKSCCPDGGATDEFGDTASRKTGAQSSRLASKCNLRPTLPGAVGGKGSARGDRPAGDNGQGHQGGQTRFSAGPTSPSVVDRRALRLASVVTLHREPNDQPRFRSVSSFREMVRSSRSFSRQPSGS
jgi:hypothetical protein